MAYLTISIVFLLVSILFFFVFKKQSTKIGNSACQVSEEDRLKSSNWDTNEAQIYERLSSLKKKQTILLLVYLTFSLVFLILYLRHRQSSRHVHSMQVSYEGLGVFSLGKNLTAHFSNSDSEFKINTMVITPNSSNPYISEIIEELYNGLNPDLFKLVAEYSVDAPEVRLSNYELTSSHLQELLVDNPETKLVISLAGFVLDDGFEWGVSKRPYIAVFSEKAELNDYVTLINRGVIDLALISKGSYASHTLIPQNEELATIFDNNFIMANHTNIPHIVKAYKQTISIISNME